MLYNLYRSTRSLFLVAIIFCGLTAFIVPTVANAQSTDEYPAEVKAQVTWLNLDSVFGTAPQGWPIPRAYLPLTKSEFTSCPAEPLSACFRVLREKDTNNQILSFWGKNPTGCRQDGYRWDSSLQKMVTGIPAGFEGPMEGLTFRPCDLMGASVSSTVSASSVITSAGSVGASSVATETIQVTNVEPYSATITAASLNARKGPGTNYARVGWYRNGTEVTVVGISGDWALLRDGNWVSMDYIESATSLAVVASSAVTTSVPTTDTMPAVVASAAVTTIVPAPLSGPTSVRLLSGNVTWSRCGQMWCWNTYRSNSNGGKPATMDVLCDMDGEFLVENVGQSPIKAGNSRLVTGITAPDRCDQ